MIDQETGEIRFPNWTQSLSHATTREQFLRSSLAQGANLQVKNEPYCSWQLKPTEWNDKWWTVVLYFEDEKLYQILLTASEHEIGQGWQSWSEEMEKSRKEYYSVVLEQLLGTMRRFPWGSIETSYDGKSGSSCMIVHY